MKAGISAGTINPQSRPVEILGGFSSFGASLHPSLMV